MAQEFKLKDLTSIDLRPGEKREVEVDGVDGGKVLLTNVAGKISALGAKCTHYGAPLVKGVLSSDGRLTCPWHGACFHATTGDIEDAPGLDNLPTFGLTEKDGGVYITGEPASIKGSRRKPQLACASVSDDKVVVVGGGSGALAAVEALREKGYTGQITMVSSEGSLPIDRTKLSKALIDDAGKIALRDAAWFDAAGITVVQDTVTAVDFAAKTITASGASFSYNKLILATGGIPRRLPLPGFDLDNIFVLRTTADTKRINAAIGAGHKKIVIIGSSFIGMEVANAVAKNNDVTVVGMEKAPLERVMGEEVGKIFQSALEGNGVKFCMSAGVEAALPAADAKVGFVTLKDGSKLPADLVILGAGVAPATSFLTGVELLKDGSLATDENFAVAGLDGVYAIGDIATYPYHGPGGNGAPVRIEHWNVAQNAGRAAASHIAHPSGSPKRFIPVFWSALGAQLRYCGHPVGGFDDVVLTGSPADKKFVAYYTKGETVVAVATMQTDPVMVHAAELMRAGKMPSKSQLQGGLDILRREL